jgi:GNAT superfamily N-acetyltransferase
MSLRNRLERTVQRAVRWGRVLVITQRLDDLRELPPPSGVTIRGADRRDLPALRDLLSGLEAGRFADHTARGRVCLVAWRDDRPIGYGWMADRFGSDMTAIACPLALPPTATYLWNLYVAPDQRGQGVGSALSTARLLLARERGLREAWRMIEPSNHPSLRIVAKTGGPSTRIIGELWYLKLMSRAYGQFHPAVTPLHSLQLGERLTSRAIGS